MADRTFHPYRALDVSVVTLAGSVAFNSSGVVTANNILGATVSRTGTGAYQILLADVFPELLGAHITIQKATAADLVPQINGVTLSSKTITFRLLAAATPTDLAEAGNFYITLTFKNSTIAP